MANRLTAYVHGLVQGVGFRWWVRGEAVELDLTGSATNLPDGRVCVVAEGSGDHLEELLHRLQEKRTSHRRPGRVDRVAFKWSPAKGERGFSVE